jgi:hypothetical protein
MGLMLLLVVGSTVWLGVDASKRDWSENKFASSTGRWVIGSLGLWIVAFPVYLVHRRRAPLKSAGPPAVTFAPPESPVASVPPPERPR